MRSSLLTMAVAAWVLALPRPAAHSAQSAVHAQTPRLASQDTTVARESAVLTYQLALDEIAAGRSGQAQALLEENIRRHGNRPELNMLLAYLLQRSGHIAEARERLAAVSGSSPLAADYAARLSSTIGAVPALPHSDGATAGATAANSGRPVTSLGQSDARLLRMEENLAGLVNAERQKNGLQPLAYDAHLADVARAHSAEMRDLKYFAHESPTASLHEPLDRFRAVFAVTPSVVAENVYRAWGTQHALSDSDVRAAHQALMNSPGHRENILFPSVTRIGVGIVTNSTGDMWVTQMFEKP